jgi:hypothetical protein
MDTIKLPISFDKGRVGLLQENTRDYYNQAVALACRIEKGELALEPTYGVKDSTFDTFRKSELNYTLATFWPEIRVIKLEQDKAKKDGTSRLLIDFSFEGA